MKKVLLSSFVLVILSLPTIAQTEQALPYPSEMTENPPSVVGVNDPFLGTAVAVSDDGEVMAIGAYGYENGTLGSGADYGSVTVYRKNASGNYVQDAFLSDITSGFANNRFGWDVALDLDGNTLAVGSPFYCNGDFSAGCGTTHIGQVYIYRYAAGVWSLEEQFNATDDFESSDTQFGASVSLTDDGNTVAIGAPGKRQINPVFRIEAGAVYTYNFAASSWTQESIITSTDLQNRDGLGFDVAISDDGSTIIAGAINLGTEGTNSNSAYIFRKSGSTWTQEAKLINSGSTSSSDKFGISVDIDDTGVTAIVGAPEDGNGKAIVYSFSGGNWSEDIALSAQSGGSSFGTSVAITGDGAVAAVGDPTANATGEAFLFSASPLNFSIPTQLTVSGAAADDAVGSAIAISDGAFEIPVGAPGNSTTTNNLGKSSSFTYPRTTLPVELVSFTAEHTGNGVVNLNWNTATETNNDGFVIERSANGQNWAEIGFVEGNGTTDMPNSYTHQDNVEGAGTYFYRLKQIDYDGAFAYSDVEQVVVEDKTFRVLVTNPVGNEIQITTSAMDIYSNAEASIYNMQGALVAQFNLTSSSQDVSGLSSGAYVLVLRGKANNQTIKFIKR